MSLVVREIGRDIASYIIANKHYKGSLGIAWESYGLFRGDTLLGVVVYGQPSPPIQKYAFRDRDFRLYELTRLVVDEGVTNGASRLVGRSLKMLKESPNAVVSYADSAMGHCGIVYQATNWLYTGATKSHDSLYVVGNEVLHPMTIKDRFGITDPVRWAESHGYEVIAPKPKFRYFYLNGTKRQKRIMRDKLCYPLVASYPKLEATRYDAGKPCMAYFQKQTVTFESFFSETVYEG